MAVFQCAIIKDACAQFRHQRQKLRTQCAELLAEFRGQARISSMIAHSKTVFFSIYGFINPLRAAMLARALGLYPEVV